jgi:hypothetical protein
MKRPEQAEQIALFHWATLWEKQIPELKWLHHVPNGGKRTKIEAVILKQMGVKSGVPDVFLDVARGGYHGLRLELKATAKDKASDNQNTWLEGYATRGYAVAVVVGWVQAKQFICDYLDGNFAQNYSGYLEGRILRQASK